MGRLLKSLALLLLLMVAQQGAFVHDLSHFASLGPAGGSIDAAAADGAPCAVCPAFAQASAPTFGYSFQFPPLDRAAPERISTAPYELISTPAPLPRSRGPPV